jgi:hypothetical protein
MLIDILKQEHKHNIDIGREAQKIKPNDLDSVTNSQILLMNTTKRTLLSYTASKSQRAKKETFQHILLDQVSILLRT